MAARAIWKAVVRVGETAIPVRLYSAVEDRAIHFRLLHDADLEPLRQVMVHPETGEPVSRDDTRRGVQMPDGSIVIVTEEELRALEPDESRQIEVDTFLPEDAVDPRWHDRPYWLGPDGDAAAWGALVGALAAEERVGLARWVMRGKRYRGLLGVRDGRPSLVTLRTADEVVTVALPAPEGRDFEPAEAKLAAKLIESLEGPFEPGAYENEHRARIRELLDAKAEGKTVEIAPYRREAVDEGSLEELLERSLKSA